MQKDKRRVGAIAELNELRTFCCFFGEQNAVVANEPDRESVNRSPTADQFVAIQRLELFKTTSVEHPGVHLPDVKRHPHICRSTTDELIGWVQRFIGRFSRARTKFLPPQVSNNFSGNPERIHFVDGEVIGQPTHPRVHLCSTEGFLINNFVDRHLHEGRPTQVRRASLFHKNRVITHSRRVCATCCCRPEPNCDRRNTGFRQLGLMFEARAPRNKDVSLMWKVCAR